MNRLMQISDVLCREMACGRSPLMTHLVGLGYSERLTLIVNDGKVSELGSASADADDYVAALLNGEEYINKTTVEHDWILWYYLWYTKVCLPLDPRHMLIICTADFVQCFG